MTIKIQSNQYRKFWAKALDKNNDNPRLKDRAWAICQALQFLAGKEYNYRFIKDLMA